jgi:ABC-type enterochelin transport system substrate-binding protein
MKHAALLLSIVCLLVFVACGQGDKTEKATVSESEKATEMAKEKAEETTEMAKEKME